MGIHGRPKSGAGTLKVRHFEQSELQGANFKGVGDLTWRSSEDSAPLYLVHKDDPEIREVILRSQG